MIDNCIRKTIILHGDDLSIKIVYYYYIHILLYIFCICIEVIHIIVINTVGWINLCQNFEINIFSIILIVYITIKH